MVNAKPILATSSIGLGIALLFVAIGVERDRFAFTSQKSRNSALLTNIHLELRLPPAMPVEAPGAVVPIVRIEELKVLPVTPPALKVQKPAAIPDRAAPRLPCNPKWRELQSGPEGRMVRELCTPAATDSVPRS